MRILVLGAGAIGGYFGARLVEAGAAVTFLVRPGRAEALARDGLRVRSPLGDAAVQVETVTADRLDAAFDLVLLSCKAYDQEDAIAAIGPAVGTHSAVLPLLNGVAHMPRLAEAFGRSRLLGGVAHLAATLRPDGMVEHLSPRAEIRFGPIDPAQDRWSAPLLDAFRRAGVDAVRSASIEQDLWGKLVFLAALAGITCLTRADVGTILETAAGESLIRQLLAECRAIAAAEGVAPDTAALDQYRATLLERGSTLTASMLRDLEAGAPTEADHVLGDLVRRARAHGMDAPLLSIAHTHLQAYEIGRTRRPRR